MKKIFCILITLAVLFSLIACSNKTNDMTTFQAIILEIHDDYYLVEPVKGSAELNSADQITVSITNINVSPQLKVGDVLEIVYDGMIAESYPAQITKVYSISIVK